MPDYVSVVFVLTTALTLVLLYKATRSLIFLFCILGWMLLQFAITRSGFYTNTLTIPPHPVLLIAPPVLFILILLLTKRGRNFIDTFDTMWLTWLHVVRIPVEFVLLWLSIYKLVPELMTFEGRNFDILSGITAPIVAFLGYRQKKLSNTVLLIWNFICLGLVLNVVINGILSFPTAIQLEAFDQPNIGLLILPFIYLPCVIVPAVFLSHAVCIRQLINFNKS